MDPRLSMGETLMASFILNRTTGLCTVSGQKYSSSLDIVIRFSVFQGNLKIRYFFDVKGQIKKNIRQEGKLMGSMFSKKIAAE